MLRLGNRGTRIAGSRLVLLGLALVVVAMPASAGAATLNRPTTAITYSAGAGEDNSLVVSRAGPNYVFTDAAGVTITPTAPCTAGGPANVALCPVEGTISITSTLGNLDDDGRIDSSVVETAQLTTATLAGQGGGDALTGSPGIRNILNGDGVGPDGSDTLTGGAKRDTLIGGGGNDTLVGGDGDDDLDGGDGEDMSNGGPGFDFFNPVSPGPDGPDVFIGGGQIDSLFLGSRNDPVRVTTDGVADDGEGCPGPGCEGDNVAADVEGVTGGDGNDILIGGPGLNDFSGSTGNDQLNGGGGYDELSGGSGEDTISGGPGSDELIGDAGADQVAGDGGDDYLRDGFSDADVDVLSGGAGIDSLGGPPVTVAPLRISLDNRPNDGFASPFVSLAKDNARGDLENLAGTELADVLTGNGAANELDGGGGADRLVGKAGGDALTGGDGGDRLVPGKGRDSAEGGGGADRISARDRTPDEILCGAAFDRVKGDRRDDIAADCDKVARR